MAARCWFFDLYITRSKSLLSFHRATVEPNNRGAKLGSFSGKGGNREGEEEAEEKFIAPRQEWGRILGRRHIQPSATCCTQLLKLTGTFAHVVKANVLGRWLGSLYPCK